MQNRLQWSRILVIPLLFCSSVAAQELPIEQEVARLSTLRAEDSTYAMLFDRFGEPRELYEKYLEAVPRIAEDWRKRQSELSKLTDLGTTKTLAILPLIDWHVANEGLQGESGVAYLVKTDDATILFDVGRNSKEEHPSPLLQNMQQVGVNIHDIDLIVISHPHGDHTGGGKWARASTFSLTDHQIDLGELNAFTPVPMEYPGIEVKWSEDPTVIAPGVATTGVINNYCFFMGEIPEQALVVNVEGKGIVVISGCGHQTLKKIVDRTEALVDAPLYGMVGGLHYPVIKCRNIDVHRYVATWKLPGEFLSIEEVQGNIDYLRQRDVGVVGLSPHDSCDASIEAFRQTFPETYRDIVVGEEIMIPGSNTR